MDQIARTDRLLFDYCLPHGRQVYEAEAPGPVCLPPVVQTAMIEAARTVLAALTRRGAEIDLPPFPMRDLAISGRREGIPFWARADLFLGEDGRPFLAELNVDKPGAQREAMAHPTEGGNFRRRLSEALLRLWRHWRQATACAAPHCAVLVDPAHREELHLAHLYAELLGEMGWSCIVAGPANLAVRGETAFAFGEPIEVLLRQFPTEFGHEVPAYAKLVGLYRAGRLLMVNGPGVVRVQAKSSFAWLWAQLLVGGGVLARREVESVVSAVPFTAVLTSTSLPDDPTLPGGPQGDTALQLLGNPERWVLKPVLGRYSQGVTCGALTSPTHWGAAVGAALAQPQYWVAQQYRPIAAQPLQRYSGGAVKAVEGYVTWGLHLLAGRPAAWIARCSQHRVTDDAWFAPVIIGEDDRLGGLASPDRSEDL